MDYIFDFFENWQYPTTLDKDKPLETTPHYTDTRFQKEQTIFGKRPESPYGHTGLHYDYSDRLWEWDYKKSKKAAKIAAESGATPKSCRWYEVYLSAYFGKSIEIEHIIAGVNRSNGYPYCVFGYKVADQ